MIVYPNQVQFAVKILQKSKHERTAKEEHHLHQLLESELFYNSTIQSYGQQGRRTFIRGIYLRNEPRIRIHNIYWFFVLYGTVSVNGSKYRSGQSAVLGQTFAQINLSPGTLIIVIERQRILKITKKWQQKLESKEIDQLKKLPFFSQMENRQLQSILKLAEKRHYVRNRVVFEQGQLAKELFIISSGTFIMSKKIKSSSSTISPPNLSPRQYKPIGKQVLLMVDADIFGEECLQFENEQEFRPLGTYTCGVTCNSSEGVLFCLKIQAFRQYPLKSYLSLPDRIYHFYSKRRQEAAAKALTKEQPKGVNHGQQEQLQNYLQKIYRSRSQFNNTSYVQLERNYYNPEVQFFEKEEFVSMKMKLKYQNILDKVDKMKSLSQKTLSATVGSTKSPRVYNRNAERERRIILKELNKQKFKRDNFDEEALQSIIAKTESSTVEKEKKMLRRRDFSAILLRQKQQKELSTQRPIYTPILQSFYAQRQKQVKSTGTQQQQTTIKIKTANPRSSRLKTASTLNFIKKLP